ncbi:MAG: nucleotidyl transferase AbiEii/AbiGii toxin family protein [Lachnospiraceae bacterium]|nr:nucleotidyl transferase AbiEii/AbiGii toxin family protein [Lachnospiraceae bacterium]
MAVKNKSASALARLRNQAKEEGISYQMSLQLFFQEEFLRRLSHSRYRDNLILKGGMFIYVLTEFDSRPTRDMDFMLRSLSNELGNIKNVMEEICSIQTDNDYFWLEVTGVEQITLEKKYPGVKTKFIGHINNVRVPFSVDVGIDDVIVPNAEIREIATRLEGFEAPEIYTYSLESTIAEKFDAILQRMDTTSRMKDFFDIYYLSNVFDFDGGLLKEAVSETTKHRGRELEEDVFARIEKFDESAFFQVQWSKFEPAVEINLPFSDTLKRLSDFLEPIYAAILRGEEFQGQWKCGQRKWISSR